MRALWSERQNCSHNVSQKFTRIRRLPDSGLVIGNGRNTVSRVLFRRRELTEFYGKLGEFGEKLGEFAFPHK